MGLGGPRHSRPIQKPGVAMLKRLVSLRDPSDSPPTRTVLHLTSLVSVVLLPRFLIQRSSGIPYYCEELLRSLRCNNMLLLHTGRPKEGEDSWQSLIGKHPCCRSAVGCGASSPAQPHLAAPLAKHQLSSLFMLPVLFLSSAAKGSPAVTAASSPGTGSDGERMCAIRPDVSLETSMLPFALKGEELSSARPVCGCAPASFPGVQVRERLSTCVLQSHPLSLGAQPGR